MPSTTSDDEFDLFPDPFTDIDWNNVPGLSAVAPSQPSAEPGHTTPSHSPTNVSDQYSYDEIDAAFLAEVDQVERRLIPPQDSEATSSLADNRDRRPETPTRSDTGSKLTSRFFHASDGPTEGGPSSLQGASGRVRGTSPRAESGEGADLPVPEAEVKSSKVVHGRSSPLIGEPATKRHKGKHKEISREIMEEVLDNLEDGMVCPICCDIFARAHLGNPCGHTVCGECGWRWIQKNGAPSCAICRADLSVNIPMIPNFAVDNVIENHVQTLRIGGIEGWESDGSKFAEWQGRKARWKTDFAKKMARRSATINISLFTVQPAVVDADYAEEEAESSGAESSSAASESEGEREAGAVQQEPARRLNPHRHHRRPGVNRNRQQQANGGRHDAGRGGSNPRGRRPRRRRRRD